MTRKLCMMGARDHLEIRAAWRHILRQSGYLLRG